MARIRTVKPEFFLDEGLFDAEKETKLPLRVAYVGLWCHCDREGRFEWRPRALKVGILPYDNVDFARVLDALATRGFIVHYACAGREYGYSPGFVGHQVINNRERESVIPPVDEEGVEIIEDSTRCPRVGDASTTRGARRESGREGKGTRKGREQGGGQDPAALRCAERLEGTVKRENPNILALRPDRIAKTRRAWAEEFDRTHRLDKRPWEEIESVLAHIDGDCRGGDGFPGWGCVVQSAVSVRRNFDKILQQMHQGSRPPAQDLSYAARRYAAMEDLSEVPS